MTITFEKIGTGPKRRSFYLSARVSAFAILISYLFTASPAWAMPPAGYSLVWSDEFNGPLGSAPNPANWTYDTGDGGWGNNELENYTNSTANSRIVADPERHRRQSPGHHRHRYPARHTQLRRRLADILPRAFSTLRSPKSSNTATWKPASRCPMATAFGRPFGCWGPISARPAGPTCGEMDIMENIGNAAA